MILLVNCPVCKTGSKVDSDPIPDPLYMVCTDCGQFAIRRGDGKISVMTFSEEMVLEEKYREPMMDVRSIVLARKALEKKKDEDQGLY